MPKTAQNLNLSKVRKLKVFKGAELTTMTNTPTAKRTADQLRGDYGETAYEQLKSSPLWTLLATNRDLDDLGEELGVKVFEYVEKLIDEKVEEIADEAMRSTDHILTGVER